MPRSSLLWLLAVLGACSPQGSAEPPAALRPAPATQSLVGSEHPLTLSFVGTVIAPRDALLSSPRGGRIEGYRHEVGAPVAAGEVVVQLGAAELAYASAAAAAGAHQASTRLAGVREPSELPSAQAARSARDAAEDAAARAERLHAQGSVSAQALTQARADAASASAHYAGALSAAKAEFGRLQELNAMAGQARAALGEQAVKAPFAGVVLERFLEIGQSAAPGAPIVRVLDPSELRIRFDVPQFEAAHVTLGARVQVGHGPERARAVVVRSSPGLVGEANARQVEARLEGAVDGVLPGARLPLWLELGGRETLVQVPRSAVHVAAGLTRAWVLDGDRLRERLLSIARSDDAHVWVRDGVRAGEQLVLAPEPNYAQGERVAP